MSNKISKLVVANLFFCLINFAHAGFIETNYEGMDAAYDSDTNLTWLNWDMNTHLSRKEVEGALQSGEILEGWRYATDKEMIAMLESFFPNFDTSSPNFHLGQSHGLSSFSYRDFALNEKLITSEILSLESTLKAVNHSHNSLANSYTVIFGDVNFNAEVAGEMLDITQQIYIHDSMRDGSTYEDAIGVNNPQYQFNYESSGHALVRVVDVPEPTTLFLFGFALFGLALISRQPIESYPSFDNKVKYRFKFHIVA